MAELYPCYSPSGEKFELTRANYLDCIQHYGFTPGPNEGFIPEVAAAPVEAVVTEPVATEAVVTEPVIATTEPAVAADAEPAVAADAASEDAELNFDTMEKDALKEFIRAKFPDAEFDGRASRDTLADLAFELVTKAEEAAE